MKNIFLTLFTACIMLSLTSCYTYAQTVVDEDGFVYEYSYNNCPIRYIDGVAYYYCIYNNVWTWIMLDRLYYDRIVRHPYPVRYVYPRHYHHFHGQHAHYKRPQRPIVPQHRYGGKLGHGRFGGNRTHGSISQPSGFGGRR